MQPLDSLKVFISPLETGKISYFVTGSIAAIFYGEPRLTHDIDIVIHLGQQDIPKFLQLYPAEEFYCPPEEIVQIETRRRPFGHFNLIHHKSGFKGDVYSDAGDRLHGWAFKHRRRVELAKDFSLWLAPPEYVIIRKLEYFREGGSEKHIEDIRKMLSQTEALNNDFLENELKSRKLEHFWHRIHLRDF